MNTQSLNPTGTEKTLWALGLGCLFLLIYGGTNQLSAGFEGLSSLYLPWETQMPFLPWTIVPYMSLDLFFVISFFRVTDRRELRGHAGRVLMAIGVFCALFLLYPMQFAFARPDTGGLFGWLFDILSVDLPYNQCPSLHVSLSLIYWPLVRRMAQGWRRTLLAIWFWMIALSTLTVYQHHLIDLFGGAILGLFVMHAIPLNDAPRSIVNRKSLRIAGRYLVASLAALGSALALGGWGLLMLYPVLSLGLVSAAYATGRADFLQKRQGKHCAVIWLLFAPYLIGTYLTWLYYRTRIEAWHSLEQGIYFGRKLTDTEADKLKSLGVTAVLDLAPEVAETNSWGALTYRHIPILDFATPESGAVREAVAFINRHRAGVYVHCSLGLFRSALIMAAYLQSKGLDQSQAIQQLKALRSGILLDDDSIQNSRCSTDDIATTSLLMENE